MMLLANCFSLFQSVEMVRFEVDDRGLAKMLRGLAEVEEQIGKHAQLPPA
jgi:hypothetical protein